MLPLDLRLKLVCTKLFEIEPSWAIYCAEVTLVQQYVQVHRTTSLGQLGATLHVSAYRRNGNIDALERKCLGNRLESTR